MSEPIVPVNLLTGFLGVGKTTAVIDLLHRKPASEKWAVLVNEYGDVSIDSALIEGSTTSGVSVREIAGGCVCCTTSLELPVALHFLLTETRPDRLIIETTGLGHPARLTDSIRAKYAGRLELRATIGIVIPGDFDDPKMQTNSIFMDQVQLADVLVLNKSDTATPETLAAFQQWANGLFPPKLLVVATQKGQLDPAWLDLVPMMERFAQFPEAHAHTDANSASTMTQSPTPGHPVRYPSRLGDLPACGWVFNAADVFNEDRIVATLSGWPGIKRLKGVFRVRWEWIAINRTSSGTTCQPIAYRRDSRVELFTDNHDDWDAIESALLSCLLVPVK